jgi:hypothetical protein
MHRSANMLIRLVSFRRVLAVGLWPVLGFVGSSCLAQETYTPKPAVGGSASTSAGNGGSAGLALAEPTGGAGEAAGMPSGGSEPSGCRTSEQCAVPLPYCLSSRGVCVECLSRTNCTGSGRRYCDLASNACVECLTDVNCTSVAPYCALAIGACVECLSNENCGSTDLVCNRQSYHCTPACRKNADCTGSPATPLCDPERSVCVECLADGDCPTATPRCASETKTCAVCLSDVDCAAPNPRCEPTKLLCVQCVSSQDCMGEAVCAAGVCSLPR